MASPPGFRQRKPPLGQHFLQSQSVLDRIAREVAAAAAKSLPVIEIGPGPGALTRELVDRGLHVTAIEIDARLAANLREEFAGNDHLSVIEADVLGVDLASLIPERAVVAGNLPYYITSPILTRIFDAADKITRAILLVQKEVADRIVAKPGNRDYGSLSVLCQSHARAEMVLTVPPGAFRPPPKVTSAVVRLTMEPRLSHWGISDRGAFLRFVQLCFHQKRKMLRNNLAGAYPREVLDHLPEAKLRAEQLSPEALADLWQRLSPARPGSRDAA